MICQNVDSCSPTTAARSENLERPPLVLALLMMLAMALPVLTDVQKATTPSAMSPLNLPPLRRLVAG